MYIFIYLAIFLYTYLSLYLSISLSLYLSIYLSFFFPAEDGIRVRNVTGVQTCALPIYPLRMLFEHVAGPVGADGAAGVFCCGLRVISVDGSVTDLPDTPQNAAFFRRPSNATRAGAFPQVRWVAAAESGTGALTGAALGPYTTGEQTLAVDLLPSFGPGMLVLADRNFLSHTLARDVLATGAHILWRASASFALKPVSVLADGTYLAELRPARKSDGPPVTVRGIEYTVHTAATGKDGGHESSSEVFALVTDLLEVGQYSSRDLACAYPLRGSCE